MEKQLHHSANIHTFLIIAIICLYSLHIIRPLVSTLHIQLHTT